MHSNAKFFINQGLKVSQSRFLRKLRIVETESLIKINAGMKLGHGITLELNAILREENS